MESRLRLRRSPPQAGLESGTARSAGHRLTELVVVVVLLFYVHGKHLRSCRDGQLT